MQYDKTNGERYATGSDSCVLSGQCIEQLDVYHLATCIAIIIISKTIETKEIGCDKTKEHGRVFTHINIDLLICSRMLVATTAVYGKLTN